MPRLFISLDMPEEIINEISKIQKHIFQRNFIVGSFTKKENLHLTLKFLGEVPEDKVEEIKNNLSKIKFKKFKVHLGELGFFGDRIFWVELLGDEIFKLQKEVDDKLKIYEPHHNRADKEDEKSSRERVRKCKILQGGM